MERTQAAYSFIASHLSRRQLSILLTIIALVLWSYSITQAELIIGFYGLIDSFPVTFFTALGILTIASAILWVSKENHEGLLFLQVSLLIVSLWLVPLLIGGSQPVEEHVREKFAENVSFILQNGSLDYSSRWYHNWPATWLLGASLIHVLGQGSTDGLIFLTPFVLQLLFILPLYLFLKNTFGEGRNNYYWAGIWVFALANWLEQSYFGPQAYAMLLFLFILYFLTKRGGVGEASYGVGHRLSAILSFVCLTITHLLTSFASIAVTTVLFIFRRIKSPIFLILVIMLVGFWMIYQTTSFFEMRFPHYIEQAFRLDLLWTSVASPGVVTGGSESHQAVAMIRMITTGVFAVLTMGGLAIAWKQRVRLYQDYTVVAIGIAILALSFTILYGAELLQRVWLLGLPVVAYFGLKWLSYRSTALILCTVLLAALPLHFISHYGNAAADYRSLGYIAGSTYAEQAQTLNGYPLVKLDDTGQRTEKEPLEELLSSRAQYLAMSSRADARWTFLHNEPDYIPQIQAKLEQLPDYNLIYANPDFSLYIYEER